MTRYCPHPECPGRARDGVPPEFVDRVSRCVDCGGSLMLGSAPNDPPEPARPETYRTVFIAADPVQAHLVRNLVEAEGIIVYLKGERLAGAIGELPTTVRQVEVQVPTGDFERARQAVMCFEGPPGETAEEP